VGHIIYRIGMATLARLGRLARFGMAALAALCYLPVHAAAPGITGTHFDLRAEASRITQPDGNSVYSWGYGCNSEPAGYSPPNIAHPPCPTMQIPGPTLIVNQGDIVTVRRSPIIRRTSW